MVTNIGHFFLFDLMSNEVIGDYRCKNASIIEDMIHFSFDSEFFKAVAGNKQGEVITFEIL